MYPRRVLLSWSSGKDSAWTLYRLRAEPRTHVVGLLTSFNQTANRVSMHAVRRELVEAQAAELDLPLWPVLLPDPCSNEAYERDMRGHAETSGNVLGENFRRDVPERTPTGCGSVRRTGRVPHVLLRGPDVPLGGPCKSWPNSSKRTV